jgi:hypothetical protein
MMFTETLLLSETRRGPIIDTFGKDYFFIKLKGRYISLKLPYAVLIKIFFVCLSASFSMEGFLTSAVFDAILPTFQAYIPFWDTELDKYRNRYRGIRRTECGPFQM